MARDSGRALDFENALGWYPPPLMNCLSRYAQTIRENRNAACRVDRLPNWAIGAAIGVHGLVS
jgi:hypothetical protein